MNTPSEQKLTLSVSKESLTFLYLVPEAGAYLGTVDNQSIYFKAPLRLTGVLEDYCVPTPPEFFFSSRKPRVVVRFAPYGNYTVEDPPTFRVVLPYESFAERVAPGFYFGSTTGASITFLVPSGRRSTVAIHTTLPGGDYVKGVDIPTLIQVAAPLVDASA